MVIKSYVVDDANVREYKNASNEVEIPTGIWVFKKKQSKTSQHENDVFFFFPPKGVDIAKGITTAETSSERLRRLFKDFTKVGVTNKNTPIGHLGTEAIVVQAVVGKDMTPAAFYKDSLSPGLVPCTSNVGSVLLKPSYLRICPVSDVCNSTRYVENTVVTSNLPDADLGLFKMSLSSESSGTGTLEIDETVSNQLCLLGNPHFAGTPIDIKYEYGVSSEHFIVDLEMH